ISPRLILNKTIERYGWRNAIGAGRSGLCDRETFVHLTYWPHASWPGENQMKLREKSMPAAAKRRNVRNTRNALLAASVGAVGMVIAQQSAKGATVVFDGGTAGTSGTWVTAVNWAGDVVPSTTDVAEFAAAGTNATIS